MIKLEMRKLQRSAPRPVPELPPSRPRPVRLTGMGWFVALIGMLLPAVALVAGFSLHARAVSDRTLREAIDREGVRVTAVVIELSQTGGKSPRYFVNYEYTAAGDLHKGRANVSRTFWKELRLGSFLTVRYRPAEPGRNWLRGQEPGTPF